MTAIITCLIIYGVGFFCFTFCDDQYKTNYHIKQDIKKEKWIIEKQRKEKNKNNVYYFNY